MKGGKTFGRTLGSEERRQSEFTLPDAWGPEVGVGGGKGKIHRRKEPLHSWGQKCPITEAGRVFK